MDADTAISSIVDWIGHVGSAGLVLPSGWFGRPFDNLHHLTWVERRGDRLLIELDGQLLLVLTGISRVEHGTDRLTIGAAQIVFDWQEYGSGVPHAETFTAAEIALVRVP